jgi:hypothetical protein
MEMNRREFLVTAGAATLAAAAGTQARAQAGTQRVFIGSNTPEGILAFDWDPQRCAAGGERGGQLQRQADG